tara:strand:+ start:1756 stop:2058 length:303 start_codon:yes stop_codon:yes gene_type:complete
MAFYQYLCAASEDCLHKSFNHSLEKVGVKISKEFSSHAQIFAEVKIPNTESISKVKVIISWVDKNIKCCSVEVRSDEPFLKKNTFCKRIANELKNVIPPK